MKNDLNYFSLWRTLPISVIAMAWYDKNFKHDLIFNSNKAIKNFMDIESENIKFIIVENTKEITHFSIPFRDEKSYSLSDKEIEEKLNYGVKDYEYKYCLSKDIIIKYYNDYNFKMSLITNPNDTLNIKDKKIYIHENSEYYSYLVLPYNKWQNLNYSIDKLESLLLQDFKANILS